MPRFEWTAWLGHQFGVRFGVQTTRKPSPRNGPGPAVHALRAVARTVARSVAAASMLAVALPGDPEGAQAQAPAPDQGTLTEAHRIAIATTLQRSSVSVRADRSTGSGFVVGPEGWVVTNAHVVRAAARRGWVQVRFGDGQVLPARILAMVPALDLALLDPEGEVPAPPLPLGSSDDVRVGQTVLAFGSPYGLDGTLTQGIVSARRRLPGARTNGIQELIQTDAPINPGNSGGPLVDAAGRVIGVNTAILSRTGGSHGIGFAVPSRHVEELLDRVRGGRARVGRRPDPAPAASEPATSPRRDDGGPSAAAPSARPDPPVWLGVVAENLVDGGFRGVRVRQAVADGPAHRAGLRGATDAPPDYVVRRRIPWTGHVVTEVDGAPVRTIRELSAALSRHDPGDEITLTVTVGPNLLVGQAVLTLASPPPR